MSDGTIAIWLPEHLAILRTSAPEGLAQALVAAGSEPTHRTLVLLGLDRIDEALELAASHRAHAALVHALMVAGRPNDAVAYADTMPAEVAANWQLAQATVEALIAASEPQRALHQAARAPRTSALAWALAHTGDYSSAMPLALAALREAADDVAASEALGLCWFATGDASRSAAPLVAAWRRRIRRPVLADRAIQSLASARDLEAARAVWTTAVDEHGPTDTLVDLDYRLAAAAGAWDQALGPAAVMASRWPTVAEGHGRVAICCAATAGALEAAAATERASEAGGVGGGLGLVTAERMVDLELADREALGLSDAVVQPDVSVEFDLDAPRWERPVERLDRARIELLARPSDPMAHLALGRGLVDMLQDHEAERCLREIADLPAAHDELARLFVAGDRFEEAWAVLTADDAGPLQDASAQTLTLGAIARGQTAGDPGEGAVWLREVVGAERLGQDAALRGGLAYVSWLAGQVAPAADLAREAIEADPDAVFAWATLGLVAHAGERWQQAAACLRRAVLHGGRQRTWARANLEAHHRGLLSAAGNWFFDRYLEQYGFESDHGFADMAFDLAFQADDALLALGRAQRSVELSPSWGEGWANLAIVLDAVGRLTEAAQAAARAVELGGLSAWARSTLAGSSLVDDA